MHKPLIAALALLIAAPALAQDERMIENPIWLNFATPPRTNSYLPREAEQRGVGGVVDLRCRAKADGELEACRVLDETPNNLGLGRAALTMTSLYKLRPRDRSGQSVEGGWVAFKVVMRCEGTCANRKETGGLARPGGAGRVGRAGMGRAGR